MLPQRILFQPGQKRDAALLLDKIMFALKRAMDEKNLLAKSAGPPSAAAGGGGGQRGGGQVGEAGAYMPGDMVAYEGVRSHDVHVLDIAVTLEDGRQIMFAKTKNHITSD